MSAPFNRATKLFNAIKLIIDAHMPQELQRLALNGLPAYRSRGHGRNAPARNYIAKAGKYMPHQGKKECARRERQLWLAKPSTAFEFEIAAHEAAKRAARAGSKS